MFVVLFIPFAAVRYRCLRHRRRIAISLRWKKKTKKKNNVRVCWAFVDENANHFRDDGAAPGCYEHEHTPTPLMTINPFTQAIRNCRRCIRKRINAKVEIIARGRPHLSFRYPHRENVTVK